MNSCLKEQQKQFPIENSRKIQIPDTDNSAQTRKWKVKSFIRTSEFVLTLVLEIISLQTKFKAVAKMSIISLPSFLYICYQNFLWIPSQCAYAQKLRYTQEFDITREEPINISQKVIHIDLNFFF